VQPVARGGLRAEIPQPIDKPHRDGADGRALSNAALHAAAFIRNALPGTWTMAR
jgi:hypothetical protein